MSAAVAELTAEVSNSGNCLREVYLGDAKHVIKHSWRLHTLGVTLTTPLVDSKSHQAYVETSHLAVSLKGGEMAEGVLRNTGERGISRRRNANRAKYSAPPSRPWAVGG